MILFFEKALEHILPHATAMKVNSFKRLMGGDINNVAKLDTSEGVFCIKWNQVGSTDMFQQEATGLNLLRASKSIGVPRVIGTGISESIQFLVIEFIEEGTPLPHFWADFGKSLAELHLTSNEHFGLDNNNFIGSLPQINNWESSWVDFFISHRLNYQLQIGLQKGAIPVNVARNFEHLFVKLPVLLPEEKPSLIHGDLWSGNFMTGPDGKAWIYDPAVHFAHREMDLAFTLLFGGFEDSFYSAYHERFPLISDWRNRIPIYQLYPLLVHVNLFGGGYINSVNGILNRFL